MKDLHTTPNEHLEARITAWVLGQASPFEVAELEALCAEDPALQSFYERTKELHSLLLETPPSSSDQFWKLSKERRAKLDPIIGPQESTYNKDSSIRRAGYRTAFGIAAVLTVTLFIKRYIIISPPMMKEAPTIVTYEYETEKASFSPQADGDKFFDETSLESKSKSVASSTPRKPSAPSSSAPAPTSEIDSGIARADSAMDEIIAGGGAGGSGKSGNFRSEDSKSRQKPNELAKAEDVEKKRSSNTAIPIEEANEEIASTPSPAFTAPKPSAKFSKEKANDGGIGYDSVNEQKDLSNTALAANALGMTDRIESNERSRAKSVPTPTAETSKPSTDFGDGKDFGGGRGPAEGEGVDAFAANDNQNKGGFQYEPGATKQEALRSYGSHPQDGLNLEGGEKWKNETSSTTVPGVPSATGTPNQTTPGLRSGDYEVARESIDAILNNPNRRADEKINVLPASEVETPVGGQSFSGGTLAQRELEGRRYNLNIDGNALTPADKELELSVRAGTERSVDPFASNKKTDDQFKSLTSSSLNSLSNVVEGGLKNDLSKILEAGVSVDTHSENFNPKKKGATVPIELIREFIYPTEYEVPKIPGVAGDKSVASELDLYRGQSDPFKAMPEEFEGFVNYGSPIQGEAKQIDITTKFVEVTQQNNKELGFDWILSGENLKADLSFASPSDPAKPNIESHLTGFTGELEIPLLGDIPITGRLFQEGEKGKTLGEAHAGYNSEYLFRGLVVGDQKKPSLIDLSEEISAEKETFSTFSLNISDASFQLALAAFEKGERPDPASIKPEQFYNAVDYGDPAPSASEPVAAAIDQTAHPVIPGRNLVRVALRTGSTGRSAAQPLRLTLLVDQSGSMVREDRRAAMETALASLATLLTENDQVTVIGFSRTPHLLAQSLPGNQADKLPDLINQTASEGGTNLEQAINLATEQALSHHLAGAQNRIVLFTDGAANLGDADPDRLSEKIKNIRQQGLAFDIAGIGTNELNDRLLSDLARHGNGRYYLVGEKTGANLATQLAGAFRPAAENVKVQVKLNPQRVGNYKLIGFEKDRLKTEDFRNDAVDAAELAADEAGVALYQVETLPQGTGEIGEVSVRFRDTASGEMVERTWTIPYDASAPSLDKANPKTQLATLALLAAQKLQPGPMADAIDFSNYSETIAKLKQANAKSAKTQQLFNLINAIK